jgi:thiosulfate dehydrogenase [quinone] large subunit
MSNYREAAYALLRVTLGVVFLTTGIVKFTLGIGNFAAGLQQEFAGKLPMVIVTPFAYVLPFVEVTVGTLLVLGLFNVIALVIAGLLLMVLTFGKTAVNDSATVAGNLSYVLIIFVLLWLADYNAYSIDRTRHEEVPINRRDTREREIE